MAAPGALAELEEFALDLPGAWSDLPWEDDLVTKVGKKIFVFFGTVDDLSIGVKLPDSGDHALSVPGASPMSYGLGKHGWVVVPVGRDEAPPELLEDWIEESYRAVATKRLVAELDARSR